MAKMIIMAFRSEDWTNLSRKLLSFSEARVLICLKPCVSSLFWGKKNRC